MTDSFAETSFRYLYSPSTVGNKIRERHESLGYSKTRLAELADSSRWKIQRMEDGACTDLLDIQRVCEAMGLVLWIEVKDQFEHSPRLPGDRLRAVD